MTRSEKGAFGDYCAFIVTKEKLGKHDHQVFGPVPTEMQAKLWKKRHELKGRTAAIVEQDERPDPAEVFDETGDSE